MIPFTRIMTIVMFGALCFVLILPLAIARHNLVIAVGICVLFIAYLAAQLVLWRRMKPRA
jgi:amino acid transporter